MGLWLPIANLVSICALLIWYPANPNDTITRLLFPGSTPQNKVFKGLEKLKRLECLKQPVCSPSSIQESKSEKRKKVSKMDNKNIHGDNNSILEKKEKLAKRRLEKLRKEKEEREKLEKEKKEEKEKRDKEKEELEKAGKEKQDKERQENLERKKKEDKERRQKERQEKKAAAKKEKEEKEAAARKEKEEKDANAKKEREERKKEREAQRKEKEEKEAMKRKEKEAKAQKDIENKKEMNEPKSTDVVIKKNMSSTSSKSRLKETSSKTKTNETAISTRKIMPSKPTTAKLITPSPCKLKKDENNKKVMESRKAAKTQKPKPDNDEKMKVKKPTSKLTKGKKIKEESPVNEKTVADKVSEAIASGEIDNSRVIKDDEEKLPFVEEGQSKDAHVNEEDEEDIELQRIKDEDDEENQELVPDIAEKMADVLQQEEKLKQENENKNNEELRQIPATMELGKEKISYTHVKTPDEVDDLPEHEVVVDDVAIINEQQSDDSNGHEE